MSGLAEIQSELPEKRWKDYSSDEIRRYWLRNMKNTDCSFIAEDEKDNKAAKVYRSFKWILSEISPVLKKILNDEANQEKDCKEIVVSNPKYIEAILFYGHMKVVDTEIIIINLVDFYECSKQYQIKALEDEVINMFKYSSESQKNANWVKLFWLSYVKYPEDQQMRAIFEKVEGHVNCNDTFAEATIDLIMNFDKELFDTFFNILLSRGVKCFKIIEAYFTKHFLEGNKNKKLEEIHPCERSLVEWYINKMDLGNQLQSDAYINGPLNSNLLTNKLKMKHLEIMQKKITTHQNIFGGITANEIQSHMQKLRGGELEN